MAEANISVAVERAVHDALRDVAEAIWFQHGIILEGASFNWIDISTAGEKHVLFTDLAVNTRTLQP